MFTYIYKNETHSDTSTNYMTKLGIDPETQESILNQAEYERVKSVRESIANSQKYLNDTDWVLSKISEAVLFGNSIDTLTEKYADILTKRQESRDAINDLETQL